MVVVDEERLRRHLLQDLHERARGAEGDVERVAELGARQIRGQEQRVGERRLAEREEDAEAAGAARAAAVVRLSH